MSLITLLERGTVILATTAGLPSQPRVSVRVHKQLQVEQVPHARVVENKDALDQDHIRGVDCGELARSPRVGLEVVDWHSCLAALDDVSEDRLHQLIVKCIWVVKVEGSFHGLGGLGWCELSVERVLTQAHYLLLLCINLTHVGHGNPPAAGSPRSVRACP